ncbi:Uncharacterised protein [Streptococcus pneumoniae]|nr:Uncharacterised protein [Streptococcus pneumoniae]
MKSCDLDQALHEHFSEEELAGHFHVLLWTFLQWHCYHTQYLSKRLVYRGIFVGKELLKHQKIYGKKPEKR